MAILSLYGYILNKDISNFIVFLEHFSLYLSYLATHYFQSLGENIYKIKIEEHGKTISDGWK